MPHAGHSTNRAVTRALGEEKQLPKALCPELLLLAEKRARETLASTDWNSWRAGSAHKSGLILVLTANPDRITSTAARLESVLHPM